MTAYDHKFVQKLVDSPKNVINVYLLLNGSPLLFFFKKGDKVGYIIVISIFFHCA